MEVRTSGMTLVILGGLILIALGALLAVTSTSTSIETINEIQIDIQNYNGTYYGTYHMGAQKDTMLINVNASKSDTFLNLVQRNWNEILYWNDFDVDAANWTHGVVACATSDGPQFQLNASLPFDGDYWVEIGAASDVVSAIGTITQTRVVTDYSQMYGFGVGILFVGSLLVPSSLFIHSYRQVKLKLEESKMERKRRMLSSRFLANEALMSVCGVFLLTLIFGLLPPLEEIVRGIRESGTRAILVMRFGWTVQHGFPFAWFYEKWRARYVPYELRTTFRGCFFIWQGFIFDFLLWGLLATLVYYFYIIRKKTRPNAE